MIRSFLAFLALSSVGTAALAAPQIDPALLSEHIKVLSSDAFEGRGPATPGEVKSVDYISSQFKSVGLEPGGDKDLSGQRTWTQDVPLARFQIKGPIKVGVQVGDTLQTWTQGSEIAVRAPETGQKRLSIKDAPVVFIGYGVNAPERHWDDFKGYDLKNKVALVLVNDPDYETGVGDFGGKTMTYYGRWTYKFEEAARQGALGFIIIHETGPASYGWQTVRNSNINDVFDTVRKDPKAVHAPLEAWVQRDQAVALFKAAGLDFDQAKKLAQTRAFKPTLLNNVSFSIDCDVDVETVVTHNVIGVIAGRTHPNERVIYTAHWDHLGIGPPDAKGDKIYNGAVDNASGVSALIELGRAFHDGPRPDRTVIMMAVTAEEKGLLGSEYYASNPVYPLATTVADINMDSLSVHGLSRDVGLSAGAANTLQDDMVLVAATYGRHASPEAHPESGGFFRSDHFSFAKRGVPAMSFHSGPDLVNGGVAAGLAAGQAYTANHYHQPSDEFDPNWDMRGMVQEVQIVFDLGKKLANSREWPEWKAGSEFKGERDKTAAERLN